MPKIANSAIVDVESGRLTVDGEPFPWLLYETPMVERLDAGLYAVHVSMLPTRVGVDDQSITIPSYREPPVIAGLEFPWHITIDGIEFRTEWRLSWLRLAFLAYHAEGPRLDDD